MTKLLSSTVRTRGQHRGINTALLLELIELDAEDNLPQLENKLGLFVRDALDEALNVTWYVNTYRVGLAYGGPEEGGWWFNVGEPDESTEIEAMSSEELINSIKITFDEKNAEAEEDNKHLPPIYSVNSRGIFEVVVEPHEGRTWPEEHTHYE